MPASHMKSKWRKTQEAMTQKAKSEKKKKTTKAAPKKRVVHDPYPWDTWFNQLDVLAKEDPSRPASIALKRGVDFTCQLHSMAVQLRNIASKAGFKISVRIDGDEVLITKRRGIA